MLPEEVTQFIGKAIGGVTVMEVEKGAIRKFADAMGDPNPLYWDEKHAKNSRYGSLIAPPGFFGWSSDPADWQQPTARTEGAPPSGVVEELNAALERAGYTLLYDGGIEYEFFAPIHAGDVLNASSMIKDVYVREGRAAAMAFMIIETTYTNQNGDVAARGRSTVIRPKPRG
ncbi:MaoC family dehydratase N-terminal domain-containing protein [Thermodesulfobacteriota bacterium]